MPRIQISPPQKGAKKPPAKDGGKGGSQKKPAAVGKGDSGAVAPAAPLDEASAATLAPIQFALVREVVVSTLNDLDMMFPHTV